MWIKCCILEQKNTEFQSIKVPQEESPAQKAGNITLLSYPLWKTHIFLPSLKKSHRSPRPQNKQKKNIIAFAASVVAVSMHLRMTCRAASSAAFSSSRSNSFLRGCIWCQWVKWHPEKESAKFTSIQIVKHLKLTLQGANIYNIPFSRHLWRWPGGIC